MLKHLLAEARSNEYHHQWGEDNHYPNLTLTGWVLLTAWWEVKYWATSQLCHFKGHDWVNEDWGGPESGGMAGHCKRCGWGFSHTLY